MEVSRRLLDNIRFVTGKMNTTQKMFLLSIVTGAVSGMAAVILKKTVRMFHSILVGGLVRDDVSFLYFLTPLVGILLTVLFVRMFIKEDIVHGITRILHSISQHKSYLQSHNMYASLVASSLTVGFGGSVGLESPIVLTGSAIGSNVGKWLGLSYRNTTLLLGCGAAAAIAGIFNAPIAGTIFVLEVFMLEMTTLSVSFLLVSAVVGATVANLFLGSSAIFSFALMDHFNMVNIPMYVFLGLFCAVVSAYFTKGTMYIEGKMKTIDSPMKKLLLGGIMLGILIFLFPPLYGEGYDALESLLVGAPELLTDNSLFFDLRHNSYFLLLFLLIILAAKVVASSVTTGAGGVGGIFAPSLFMGGVSGFIVARALRLCGLDMVSERNFTLVGMAGLMAGVMHAPLTSIFLIAEITGGYALFIPLILTSTVSYFMVRMIQPYSIYTQRLARRGELITHDRDKAVLTLMNWKPYIEKDLMSVDIKSNLGDLVKVISVSNRNMFPVLENGRILRGVILLDDVREMMFDQNLYETVLVRNVMGIPPETIDIKDTSEVIMKKFEETSAWNLPVVNGNEYVGFISKSRLLSTYRNVLVKNSFA